MHYASPSSSSSNICNRLIDSHQFNSIQFNSIQLQASNIENMSGDCNLPPPPPPVNKRPWQEIIHLDTDDGDDKAGVSPLKRLHGSVEEEEEEDLVQVLSPPQPLSITNNDNTTTTTTTNPTNDSPMVVASNLTNPNIDYPHKRIDCGVHSSSSDQDAVLFCPKCYCVLCQIPASQCIEWKLHCRQQQQQQKQKETTASTSTSTSTSTTSSVPDFLLQWLLNQGHSQATALQVMQQMNNPYSNFGRSSGRGRLLQYDEDYEDDVDDDWRLLPAGGRRNRNRNRNRTEVLYGGANKTISEMRITEVLEHKLQLAVMATTRTGSRQSSPDIVSALSLTRFFVEGIPIGWPFSTILLPQRLMAVHIIKALKRKLHCVLESPTGTGKSAAILCSTLAFQRQQQQQQQQHSNDNIPSNQINDHHDDNDNNNNNNNIPTILYGSRTHSQVAQMIQSLKKTPYRPRICVLGSRERLCIHKDIVKNNNKGGLNQACRDRKQETDRQRKHALKSDGYDDENPTTTTMTTTSPDDDVPEDTTQRKQSKPCCNHYRQLSTTRTATMTQQRFVWNHQSSSQPKTSTSTSTECCPNNDSCSTTNTSSGGGEETAMGVHDIEDLVAFGKNPYRERNIVLYANNNNSSNSSTTFGINLTARSTSGGGGGGGGCQVDSLVSNGIAARDGRLQLGDWILAVHHRPCRNWNLEQLCNFIQSFPNKLILDVQRHDGERYTIDHDDNDDDEYSEHAACPYYLSRALLPHANLIFCPYNYILDPVIRKTLGVKLNGSIVVLDEAHNVEDTLCESGSGEFGELDLCQLISVLARYSNMKKRIGKEEESRGHTIEVMGEGMEVSTIAHELLLFVERLVLYMRTHRLRFENNSVGLQKTKQEHEKFHLPDTHSVEVAYHGPTGHGFKGEAIGCANMLKELDVNSEQLSRLTEFANSMESHLFGGSDDTNSENGEHAGEAVLNDLIKVVSRLELAAKNPEHFYMACVMKPNGNIDYATEMDENDYAEMKSRQKWRKDPRPIPFVSPRAVDFENIPLNVCNHKQCASKNEKGFFVGDKIRHGDFCNGSRPRWECHLVLRLLSPGLLMKDISDQCRSLILASGSLAPLPSLCAELNLFGGQKVVTDVSQQPSVSNTTASSQLSQCTPIKALPQLQSPQLSQPLKSLSPNLGSKAKNNPSQELRGRLQVAPKPLEANHVVDLPKQLYAVSIGHFSDGAPLTVSYSNYKEPSFFPKLGHSIATVIESIPKGGVLVFFPSYTFLNKCIKCWNPRIEELAGNRYSSPQIWGRLMASKGKVIVEPTGNQGKFEEAREEYTNKIKEDGKCILLAVFRGKMSEGISFNDDNARCVICVGLPYPNSFDRNIKAKKIYNDEQRKIRKNTHLLPGADWYSQQAYRAIAQALGRCIRHGADYGAVILMDSRHCDDGSPNDGICRAHKNLPKWMRHHIRTLSMRRIGGVGHNPVMGGFEGLRADLGSFFQQAPLQSKAVLDKWKSDLQKAQARSREFQG